MPELLGWQYAPGVVDGVMRNEHYDGFHIDLETGPHSAVHTALSGEVGDMGPFTSPNGMFVSCLFYRPFLFVSFSVLR